MISDIAFARDQLDIEPGATVIYELAASDLGLFPTHAAIAINQDPAMDKRQLIVLDWPDSLAELSDEDVVSGVGLCLEIQDAGVISGHVDPSEIDNPPDPRLIYDWATKILINAIRNYDDTIDPYRVYPARPRDQSGAGEKADFEKPFVGSCVGFVEECFARASFDLVDDDENNLPEWTIPHLAAIAHHIFHLRRPPQERFLPRHCENNNIPVPYRIFMPGYQLAAFREKSYPFTPETCMDAVVPLKVDSG